MNTADLSKPITSTQLNENMFKKFGVKVNLDKYTREELENYRNLIRTKIFNHESKSNFNDLLTNETYQKNKYIVNILNQRIKEIVGESKINEGAKVDRMVKHIEKSERKAGKSKKDAENIAWATANKRGMLDNKNKKKTKEGTEDTTMKKTTEALKGKQTKLDKNHNGKLDKDDFKKLRAGKKDESMEEGWDDMMKAAKEKKDSTTGKFDKKKTSTGTQYTRKSSTFTDGGDDSDTKKAKKKAKAMESGHKRNVKLVNEAIIRFIVEDEEGKAKSITAGTDMVNDFTSWMTRVGQYQTKSMIELADAIRANFGQQEAETFKSSVQPALDAALQALTQAREEISNSVAVLAGEAPAAEPMGGMDDMSGMDDMENPGEGDLEMGGDEFAGSDAAAGGMETPGREMRESRKLFASKLAESHNLMRSLAK
jgi:hypothetical protein